jgi:pentafunctional AROM polypeptide
VVEHDTLSASYPLALAAITGGEITVDNIGSSSVQGDAQYPLDGFPVLVGGR